MKESIDRLVKCQAAKEIHVDRRGDWENIQVLMRDYGTDGNVKKSMFCMLDREQLQELIETLVLARERWDASVAAKKEAGK